MRDVWNLSDLEIVASFEMKAVSTFGILLGAYDLNGQNKSKPIGFIYGFPKFPASHYSHQMGIDKKFQNKNIGFLLKKEHRRIALESTNPVIEKIEWTVDPLLGPNATLNFRKLGVVCNTYYPNFYGNPQGAVDLYPALPTDRILVEWRISSKRVIERFDKQNPLNPNFNSVSDLYNEFPPLQQLTEKNNFLRVPEIPPESKLSKDQNNWSLQVPDDFTLLSEKDIEWAKKWRIRFREICQKMFNNEYYLVDFFSFKQRGGKRKNVYIFTRDLDEYKY
jgi:predicted GNAT superfamily acetyltransferase